MHPAAYCLRLGVRVPPGCLGESVWQARQYEAPCLLVRRVNQFGNLNNTKTPACLSGG